MAAGLLSDVGDAKGATTDDRAQSGLASLIIGAVLLLDSSITLVFNMLLWRSGPEGLPIVPAFAGAILGLLVVLCLAAFGIGLGVRGCAGPPAIGRHAAPAAYVNIWLQRNR